jgi:hypothetical protein
MDESKGENNSYLALREEKIARNEARLKELGLWKPTLTLARKQQRAQVSPSSRKRSWSISATSIRPISGTQKLRRSSRLSGKDGFDENNYSRSSLVENEKKPRGSRKREAFVKVIVTKQASSQSKPTAVAANSVRALSLSAPRIVEKFLGRFMEHPGKEFVINQAFHEASASPEEQQRVEGMRLSFNKYCGVQLWNNGAFLWVNMGGDASSNAIVNEFLQEGRLVTWYGGSRMYEDSSVIQTLLKLGKQANTSTDAGIILWCRVYNAATRRFSPYCSLGRLVYHSHVEGSYPVAFTWELLDYSALLASSTSKEVFQRMTNS